MAQVSKGIFVVFEGIDGSGKSTQIKLLSERLEEKGINPYMTFEPTDGPVGKLIRKMLSGRMAADQRTIAGLFAADRTDHLMNEKNGIRHKIDQGRTVLCDRYYFSSFAYHSQYMDLNRVIQANAVNADILKPDLTVFIDAEPDLCFKRVMQRGDELEMYEKMDVMEKVRANYFAAFKRLEKQETVRVVDGNLSVKEVCLAVWEQVKPVFENC